MIAHCCNIAAAPPRVEQDQVSAMAFRGFVLPLILGDASPGGGNERAPLEGGLARSTQADTVSPLRDRTTINSGMMSCFADLGAATLMFCGRCRFRSSNHPPQFLRQPTARICSLLLQCCRVFRAACVIALLRRDLNVESEMKTPLDDRRAAIDVAFAARCDFAPDRMLDVVERVRAVIALDLLVVGAREDAGRLSRHDRRRPAGRPGLPLVQCPLRHRRHGGLRPRRELARRAKPRLGRMGGEGRRGQRDVPLRLPEQSGRAREDAARLARTARPLSLHRRLPRQDALSLARQRLRRGASLLLRPLPPGGEGGRPRPRCRRATVRRSRHRDRTPRPRGTATAAVGMARRRWPPPIRCSARFLRFRIDSITRLVAEAAARGRTASGARWRSTCFRRASRRWSARITARSRVIATGRSR